MTSRAANVIPFRAARPQHSTLGGQPQGGEDAEQAHWLAGALDHHVLFNHATGRWHVFDPETGLWLPDLTKQVHERVIALTTARLGAINPLSVPNDKERSALTKVYRRLLERNRVGSALEVLSWMTGYKTAGKDWDTDPYLLGCVNGVVDLRTGKLLTPDPTSRVSLAAGVRYDDSLDLRRAMQAAPRFMRFLAEVTSEDEALFKFYLRWYGYSLFGNQPAHKFLIMYGRLGRNGKGALKRLLLHIFGEYAIELDPGFYEAHRWTPGANEARADLMSLRGARLAFVSEPTGAFNTEVLKNHTGEDRITARALHSNEVLSWQAGHTINFLTNNIPPVSDVGLAIADRVLVTDFRERFTGDRQDQGLDDELAAEAEAVMVILVRMAADWYAQHVQKADGLLPLPQRILDASAAYMASNDPTSAFIEARCSLAPAGQVRKVPLYEAYSEWHGQSDVEGQALSPAAFGAFIAGKFEAKGKPVTWRGISLVDQSSPTD